jgi:hypothetical protein
VIASSAAVPNQGIQGEKVFQQAADPLPAVPDRAFGGAHQLGDEVALVWPFENG